MARALTSTYRYHGFWFGNAEGESDQFFFRCDAAVCAEQKMDKEVNVV